MEEITIQLPTPVSIALAVSQGWKPVIEDTTQPLIGDEYPKIANPVTYQEFIASIAPAYLSSIVLKGGQKNLINNLNSVYEKTVSEVKSGKFDELIIEGDIDGIMSIVKESL